VKTEPPRKRETAAPGTERRLEVAALLARGFLRLHVALKKSAMNGEEGLDAGGKESVYAAREKSIL